LPVDLILISTRSDAAQAARLMAKTKVRQSCGQRCRRGVPTWSRWAKVEPIRFRRPRHRYG